MYKETTLDEFKTCLDIEIAGGKSGITICFRGLNRRDRREARDLLRDRRDHEWNLASAARRRLDVDAVRQHQAKFTRWAELLERFNLIGV
jgi:hypothetical protein